MSTETAAAAKKAPSGKDEDKAKKSFWTLSRKPKDDATEHPPFEPTLPHVNLLPDAIKDSISAHKLRRWFILGGLLLAAIVAGVWYLQSGQISSAEKDLASAQVENAKLKKDLNELNPVKDMYGQITQLQTLVTTTMASQPEASLVLEQLIAAGDASSIGGRPVSIDTANVDYTGIPQDPTRLNECPNPDPFTTEVTIGCVNFTATASNRQQVSELLRVLDADPLFSGPFVTTTSLNRGEAANGSQDTIVFSGTAGVSLEALKTKLTPEQIEKIITPPKPSPSASPSESGAAS